MEGGKTRCAAGRKGRRSAEGAFGHNSHPQNKIADTLTPANPFELAVQQLIRMVRIA